MNNKAKERQTNSEREITKTSQTKRNRIRGQNGEQRLETRPEDKENQRQRLEDIRHNRRTKGKDMIIMIVFFFIKMYNVHPIPNPNIWIGMFPPQGPGHGSLVNCFLYSPFQFVV